MSSNLDDVRQNQGWTSFFLFFILPDTHFLLVLFTITEGKDVCKNGDADCELNSNTSLILPSVILLTVGKLCVLLSIPFYSRDIIIKGEIICI